MKLANSLNKKDEKIKSSPPKPTPEIFCQILLGCKLLNYTSTNSAEFAFSVLENFTGGSNQ
ncbi:MAG: hypothetical protein ACPLRY_06745 [Candidatus Bathyarchaeales archaeon]